MQEKVINIFGYFLTISIVLLGFSVFFTQLVNAEVYVGGSNDVYFSKLDSSGNLLFTKDPSSAFSVAVDSEENVYVGYQVGYVKKYDSSGNELFAISVSANVRGLAVDSDDNVYIGDGGLIEKYDSSGNFIWQYFHGGSIYSLAVDSNGNVYSASTVDTVIKVDSSGNLVWTYTGFSKSVFSVAVDNSGNYVYAGGWDNDVRKLDVVDGSKIWEYEFGNIVWGLVVDSSGDILVSGQNNEVRKIDDTGSLIWTYTGHSANVQGLAVDSDDNVYSGNDIGVLHKLDSSGNFVWEYDFLSGIIYSIDILSFSSVVGDDYDLPEITFPNTTGFYDVDLYYYTFIEDSVPDLYFQPFFRLYAMTDVIGGSDTYIPTASYYKLELDVVDPTGTITTHTLYDDVDVNFNLFTMYSSFLYSPELLVSTYFTEGQGDYDIRLVVYSDIEDSIYDQQLYSDWVTINYDSDDPLDYPSPFEPPTDPTESINTGSILPSWTPDFVEDSINVIITTISDKLTDATDMMKTKFPVSWVVGLVTVINDVRAIYSEQGQGEYFSYTLAFDYGEDNYELELLPLEMLATDDDIFDTGASFISFFNVMRNLVGFAITLSFVFYVVKRTYSIFNYN